jgi:V8-like Glu-specific endopeptidase
VDSETNELQEVIVTATAREHNINDVPHSAPAHLRIIGDQFRAKFCVVALREYLLASLKAVVCIGLCSASSTSWTWPQHVHRDNRVVMDRLHENRNPNNDDGSFLDAVGAVWPYALNRVTLGYSASTGFLIDQCHVLTNMHVVYTDDDVTDAPVGKSVWFAVGQTDGNGDKGALQGLRFLLSGTVVAHGNTIIVGRQVQDPDSDWAIIHLAANVDRSIAPMTITAVDTAQLQRNIKLSVAGFPADHRQRRSDGLNLKDLWVADGQVVGVRQASAFGALVETTIQTTRGNSGGPLYGDFDGQKNIVIGMVQSLRGNGIDVSESMPNIQILFTPSTIASFREVQAQTPCSG